MSVVRTLPSVTVATAGNRVPVYTGPAALLLTNTSYYILNGIAVFNVANTFTPNGVDNTVQQINLYGFTTGTYFNGVPANVIWATPTQFAIYFNNANVGSAAAPQADAGKIFPTPRDMFQSVRIEIDKGAASATLFVGDVNVSATRYAAHLSLTGQIAYVQSGNKVDAHRIYLDTDTNSTVAQISATY
jgi:hypothetical protein